VVGQYKISKKKKVGYKNKLNAKNNNMAKIKIKGIEGAISLPEEEGLKIKEILENENYPPDEKISLPSVSCQKRDVKTVVLEGSSKKDEREKKWEEGFRQFLEERKAILRTTPEQRAKDSLSQFKTLYKMCFGAGKEPNEKMLRKAERAAKLFYEKNPNWTIVHPLLWLKVLGFKDKFPIAGLLGQATWRLFRAILGTEYRLAKSFKQDNEKG
jgi:hypothetical protein